jgi:hypothetical protein
MVAHKVSAADTRCKGTKIISQIWNISSNSRHRARAWRQLPVALYFLVHSNGVRGSGADKDVENSINVAVYECRRCEFVLVVINSQQQQQKCFNI